MRQDPQTSVLTAIFREPRHVVEIVYETGSIYMTSHTGMTSVPGNAVYGVLEDISSTSAELFPGEGRATIGSMSFSVVDLAGAITDEIRDQLFSFDRGVRLKEVRVFTGDSQVFTDLVRVETYVIDDVVEVSEGTYRFACSDRQRELRQDIFVQVGTRLTMTLTEEATTVAVQTTDGFHMVAHTSSFSDAPGDTVGYIRVRKTGEVIRYTGTTANSFTGCTRERFSTIAQEVVVEDDTEADKLPEIEEFIYLEMPGPQMLYAIQTGDILGTVNSLPDTWHLGIDPVNVYVDSYQNIGADLYKTDAPGAGLVMRFTHLQKTDGKRFIEEQLHIPMTTFGPIDSYGRLVLKKLVPLISTASPVAVIDHSNLMSYSGVRHVQSDVINEVVFDWSYDGEEYTRTEVLINAGSISVHGYGQQKSYELGGLHVSRHSRTTIQRIMDSLTDRYGAPPIELEVEVSCALNRLEIGDVVRLSLPDVRDYTSIVGSLNRAFEIQSVTRNWITGAISFRLFGSTARTDPDAGTGTTTHLSDAWMISEGTPLTSVLTIVGDHVTANGTVTGGTDLRSAIFYYDGDLTIDAAKTVLLDDNVQLRITGELTINGLISGAGRGEDPIADPNVVSSTYVEPSVPADFYAPNTVGATGSQGGGIISGYALNGITRAGVPALSRLALEVRDGVLYGIPAEIRGTAGVYGAPLTHPGSGSPPSVATKGGAGGAGGAGLMIICRGLAFGVSGSINLSGANGSSPTGPTTLVGYQFYAGAGGGGAAGGLYVILDGDTITFPDLDTEFVATRGSSPYLGNPTHDGHPSTLPAQPWTSDKLGLPAEDSWESAHFVQYTPRDASLGEGEDEIVPAPQDFNIDAQVTGAQLTWTPPPPEKYDYIEVFESITNDRTDSLRVALIRGDGWSTTSDTEVTRWYWIRARKTGRGVSAWVPLSSTFGTPATFGGASVGPPGADAIDVSIIPNASTTFVQAPDGGAWSHDEVSVVFNFSRAGVEIASRTLHFVRTGSNVTGSTSADSGEPTTDGYLNNGTPVCVGAVQHTNSTVTRTVTVTAVQGGSVGSPGSSGSPGEDAWTPVLSSGMGQSGKTFYKGGGINDWSDGFYSTELYGSCVISWQPQTTTDAFMIGLNADPHVDHSYTSIDYALYCAGDGTLYIYEHGVYIGAFGAYSAGQQMQVQYDGNHVRYLRSGTALRTVANIGAIMGADSSFYTVGSQANNVQFTGSPGGQIDLTTQIWNTLAAGYAGFEVSELTGSVAVAQLITNVMFSMQTVTANLATISAELGEATISTTGHLKSGQTAYNTGVGWFIGFEGGYPKLSIGNPGGSPPNYLTWDTSTGIMTVKGIAKFTNQVDTFTPTWGAGFSVAPTGDMNYIDFETHVMMWVDDTGYSQGTSNGATMSITNIPSAIQPPNIVVVPCMVINNSLVETGYMILNGATASFFPVVVSGARVVGGTFTGSGQKALPQGSVIVWPTTS